MEASAYSGRQEIETQEPRPVRPGNFLQQRFCLALTDRLIYNYLRPGIEAMFYEAKCREVIDPFGIRIRFNEI